MDLHRKVQTHQLFRKFLQTGHYSNLLKIYYNTTENPYRLYRVVESFSIAACVTSVKLLFTFKKLSFS